MSFPTAEFNAPDDAGLFLADAPAERPGDTNPSEPWQVSELVDGMSNQLIKAAAAHLLLHRRRGAALTKTQARAILVNTNLIEYAENLSAELRRDRRVGSVQG